MLLAEHLVITISHDCSGLAAMPCTGLAVSGAGQVET
jgi:hypothetical protein